MAKAKKTQVQTTTETNTAQKIALLYMIGVGLLVLGSVAFSAVYTWTANDNSSVATQGPTRVFQNGEVLGVDQTFTTLTE